MCSDVKNIQTKRAVVLFWLLLLVSFWTANVAEADEKMLFGVVEKVTFIPEEVTLSAKLDTGAKTSSLGVSEMKIEEKNGEKWIHFKVNTKKGPISFFKKLAGYKKIKIREAEKKIDIHDRGYITRPYVMMEVRLANRQELISVNLANRKNFIYPFLLGRDAIAQFGGVIDPAQRFAAKKHLLVQT